jgi:secondary thiamine-phosphate synthase enzyme
MKIITEEITFNTKGNSDITDITPQVSRKLNGSALTRGSVLIFVPGSTGALTTIEYEPGLEKDMKDALNRLVPREIEYAHNLKWGDGNGHSHIRASILGPSLTIPFINNKLMLGTWQQIVFIDMDNRARTRKLIVQITGE